MGRLADWGNYPVIDAEPLEFEQPEELREKLRSAGSYIAYGNGRSYGDASLQKKVLHTRRYRSLHAFDPATGVLIAESGVLLAEILELFVPRGWFLPVSPGTKFVTLGGAVAADIHGKNHHVEGSFGAHVLELEVMRADGSIITCSPEQHPEFFALTVGGMGLSGVILKVTLQLKPIESAYIEQQTLRATRLEELMAAFEKSANWNYSVAWVDTLARGEQLGRGIFMRGRHASADQLIEARARQAPLQGRTRASLSVPCFMPNGLLNRRTMQAFNWAYYQKTPAGSASSVIDYERFFYPLDGVKHWNRMYGKRGFMQYQFVLPRASSALLKPILERISASRCGSFLAVLKLFGEQESFISFPMGGYTLALDFPVTIDVFKLMRELDAMVLEGGGRLYMAKDARMDEQMFAQSYPQADAFREAIATLNSGSTRFASLLSNRLGITS